MCYVLPETARSIVELTRSGLPDVKTPGKAVDKQFQALPVLHHRRKMKDARRQQH